MYQVYNKELLELGEVSNDPSVRNCRPDATKNFGDSSNRQFIPLFAINQGVLEAVRRKREKLMKTIQPVLSGSKQAGGEPYKVKRATSGSKGS